MWLLLLALTASAQDCPDTARKLGAAEEYVLNFLLEDARQALDAAEAGFSCSGPADPSLIARFFNAEGMVSLLKGDPQGAALAFSAAARAEPTVWNPDYGEQARSVYEVAAGVKRDAGTMAFLPAPQEYVVRVDGEIVESPFTVPAGLHLVQIGPTDGDALFAKRVEVRPGEQASVATGLGAELLEAAGAGGRTVVVVQTRPIPPVAQGLSAPFARGEGGWADGAGTALDWPKLSEIARYDTDGKRAVRRFQGSQRGLLIAAPVAAAGAYGSYLLAWDLTVGNNLRYEQGAGTAIGLSSAVFAVTAGAAVLSVNGGLKKKRRRTQVVEAAGRVASGQAL